MKLLLFATSQAKPTLSSQCPMNGYACVARNSTDVTISSRIGFLQHAHTVALEFEIIFPKRFCESQCEAMHFTFFMAK